MSPFGTCRSDYITNPHWSEHNLQLPLAQLYNDVKVNSAYGVHLPTIMGVSTADFRSHPITSLKYISYLICCDLSAVLDLISTTKRMPSKVISKSALLRSRAVFYWKSRTFPAIRVSDKSDGWLLGRSQELFLDFLKSVISTLQD